MHADLRAARRLLRDAAEILDRLAASKDAPLTERVLPSGSVCAHRRAHRTGRPPRIESDPDLRAFVDARLDTHTFVGLAAEVARLFPAERRVGKSALHAYFHRQKNLQPHPE